MNDGVYFILSYMLFNVMSGKTGDDPVHAHMYLYNWIENILTRS